jgi:membrane protease YdiL (CAAX protease family)
MSAFPRVVARLPREQADVVPVVTRLPPCMLCSRAAMHASRASARPRPDRISGRLYRVVRHCALALVVSSILGAVALQAFAFGGLPGADPDPHPLRLELRLSDGALPAGRTAPLIADLAADLHESVAEVAVRPDGTWLVVRSATEERRRAANRGLDDVLRRHGFTRSTIRLASRWGDRFAEMAGDPLAVASRYAAAIPILVALGGVGFAAVGWYLRRRYPEPEWEAGTLRPAWAGIVGVGVGCAALATVTVLEWLLRWIGAPVQEQPWAVAIVNRGGGALAALVVLAVVVAPLGEELFFRGHVFRHLAAGGSAPLAYLCSAGAFAVAHGNNPSGLPAYLAYGLVLAWSFNRWRSLAVPVVAHATVNGVGVGLLIWQRASTLALM